MKIAIITDSTAAPTKEQQEKYQFEIVPINVRFEGKVYRDFVDLTASQAYQFLDKNPKDWATSAPSPGDFLSAYKKMVENGSKEILCLAISPKISATLNSARMAKELAKTELPDIRIEVIDTRTIASGETLLCLTAAKEIEKGRNFDEIIQTLENLKEKVKIFVALETIRYVYRSGRIPEVASKIGAILPLKPILTISDGSLHLAGATTSKRKSIEKVLKILKEGWDENLPEIGIQHADCFSEAEELKNRINQLLPAAQIFVSECSPIIGYATGRGSLVIAFFAK